MLPEGSISGHNVVAGVEVQGGGTVNVNFTGPAPPATVKPFNMTPFPPDHLFVERPTISNWIDKIAGGGSRGAALVGLGGVGKSQMAINHAYKVRKERPSTFVFWVHASSLERFKVAYQDIAERLQLPQRNDPTQNVLHLVHRWLIDESNGPWLLIIDNADDKDVLTQAADSSGDSQPLVSYVPKTGRGFILVTSRSERAAEMLVGDDALFPVSVMDRSQAKDLLLAKVGLDLYDDDAASGLVDALDRMPLAIVQAASFIKRRSRFGETIAKYVKKFLSSKEDKEGLLDTSVVDLRRDVSASKTVLAAWQLTFNQVQRERKSAAELLFFMSFFHPQGIPAFVLETFYDTYKCGKLDVDMELLTEYAFISATEQGRSLDMHTLVQFCTQTWLASLADLEAWRCKFMHIMAAAYPEVTMENWETCRKLQPHVQRAIEKRPETKGDACHWVKLLEREAAFLYLCAGDAREAEVLFRLIIETDTELFGQKHERTLSSMSALTEMLVALGKVEEAEALGKQTLDAMEETIGEKHPKTLAVRSIMIGALLVQDKFSEAQELSRTTLELMRDLVDEGYDEARIGLDNQVAMLLLLEQPAEAEMRAWKIFEANKKSVKEGNFHTLVTLALLAMSCWAQSKRSEAIQLLRECIELQEKRPAKSYFNMDDMMSTLKEWELAVGSGSPDAKISPASLR